MDGGKLKLTYNDGSTEEIDMTLDMVSGFDNRILGEQELTVTCSGKTTAFSVKIIEADPSQTTLTSENKFIFAMLELSKRIGLNCEE